MTYLQKKGRVLKKLQKVMVSRNLRVRDFSRPEPLQQREKHAEAGSFCRSTSAPGTQYLFHQT